MTMSMPYASNVLQKLHTVAFTYPAIDNHAHALLRPENRTDVPFEGLVSHLQGEALLKDAPHTLACHRATQQLSNLYGLAEGSSWEEVKANHMTTDYTDLCSRSFGSSGIQCILLDDGLGIKEMLQDIPWHDQFTQSPTRRVIRIEAVVEDILRKKVFANYRDPKSALITFTEELKEYLADHTRNGHAVAFKTVVCYRTGLAVPPKPLDLESMELLSAFSRFYSEHKDLPKIRLQEKVLNDYVVHLAMDLSAVYDIPIQFHTGLGDNDLLLDLASPKHLQPLIKAYPKTKIVLLHASYPYTREAGYLTAIHPNVYLDFGEIVPYVSRCGQRAIIEQILELAPTNKIMWSSDGHIRPESYYLGSIQAREALYEVLSNIVRAGELSEAVAIDIVQKALFHNANRLYKLNLQPKVADAHDKNRSRNTSF
ncbi:hypothetical protein C0989_008240 [Termitomyces sp. Mn162]|nr:hypothetical protein C0989_008240 [Termitomyces sp. Mn162]